MIRTRLGSLQQGSSVRQQINPYILTNMLKHELKRTKALDMPKYMGENWEATSLLQKVCRHLRKARGMKIYVLRGKAHQLVIQKQTAIPETIHTRNKIQI